MVLLHGLKCNQKWLMCLFYEIVNADTLYDQRTINQICNTNANIQKKISRLFNILCVCVSLSEYTMYLPTYVICHCSCKWGLVSNRDICETVN